FQNVANGQRLFTSDGAGSFQVNYGTGSAFASNRLVLSNFVTAIPEPSTYVAVSGCAALGWVIWRKRRGARIGRVKAVLPRICRLFAVRRSRIVRSVGEITLILQR